MTFSPMQRLFAQEYPVDLNATQAAIRAGYSPETAASQERRLLRNVEIEEKFSGPGSPPTAFFGSSPRSALPAWATI
jgi:hypothetical protein